MTDMIVVKLLDDHPLEEVGVRIVGQGLNTSTLESLETRICWSWDVESRHVDHRDLETVDAVSQVAGSDKPRDGMV